MTTSSGITVAGIRRRWPLIVVSCVTLTAPAALFLGQQGPTYAATTTVMLNPIDGRPYSPGSRGERLDNLTTEAQLVEADPVTRAVRTSLGVTTPVAKLQKRLRVTNPPNTQILEIEFSAGSPTEARNGSRQYALTFLQHRQDQAERTIAAQIDRLDAAIRTNETALAGATTALQAAAVGSSDAVLAQQRVQSATRTLSDLTGRVSDLRSSSTEPGEVLTPPSLPQPDGLPVGLLVAVSALLGAALGVGIAAWRDLLDDRVHRLEDLDGLGLTVLGEVLRTRVVDHDGRVQLLEDPSRDLPDDVRVLGTVLAATVGGSATLVLAPAAGAGGSTGPALAAALARSGQEVALADVGTATLTERDGQPMSPGLSEVLVGGVDIDEAVRETQPGLAVLPWGEQGDAAVEKLSSRRMRDVVDELGRMGDWVVLMSRSADRPETLALASTVGRAILTVTLGATRMPQLRSAAADLARCGVEVVGVLAERPADAWSWRDGHGRGRSSSGSRHLPGDLRLRLRRDVVPPEVVTAAQAAPEDDAAAESASGDRPKKPSGPRRLTDSARRGPPAGTDGAKQRRAVPDDRS